MQINEKSFDAKNTYIAIKSIEFTDIYLYRNIPIHNQITNYQFENHTIQLRGRRPYDLKIVLLFKRIFKAARNMINYLCQMPYASFLLLRLRVFYFILFDYYF